MTPQLFAGTNAEDEYSFLATPGAVEKLRDHQKTFIREDDFRWMSENGVNAVRIPVGYWIFDGDPPYRSCIGRLDWAVRMAKKYNIRVLISLHGAPGSQNGHDHSGRKGQALWWVDNSHQKQTIDILRRLAERYRDQPAVWGIELLNEPRLSIRRFMTLRRFYQSAYEAIRRAGRSGLAVVYSDAFLPRLFSGALWPYGNFPVYMDHHWYHFFIPAWLQAKVPLRLYWWYLRRKQAMLRRLSRAQPVVIGEWNGVLGGEKLGRYPKSQHNTIVAEHLRFQLEAYSVSAGWFYWSYKTEDRGVFHFRSLVEDGVLEMPLKPYKPNK